MFLRLPYKSHGSYAISGHEPERLHDEQNQLLEKTRSLAFKDYRTFIEAANCSREIYKDVCFGKKLLLNVIGSCSRHFQ